VNAPGRRYCRECGGRLVRPCPVCYFFNGLDDKHCGGCGRRATGGANPLGEGATAADAAAPAAIEEAAFAGDEAAEVMPSAASSLAEQNVSQSEIDGLFENILDEDEGSGGGAA
jgi:hypothetical protein